MALQQEKLSSFLGRLRLLKIVNVRYNLKGVGGIDIFDFSKENNQVVDYPFFSNIPRFRVVIGEFNQDDNKRPIDFTSKNVDDAIVFDVNSVHWEYFERQETYPFCRMMSEEFESKILLDNQELQFIGRMICVWYETDNSLFFNLCAKDEACVNEYTQTFSKITIRGDDYVIQN